MGGPSIHPNLSLHILVQFVGWFIQERLETVPPSERLAITPFVRIKIIIELPLADSCGCLAKNVVSAGMLENTTKNQTGEF